jgi:hypothetical protein
MKTLKLSTPPVAMQHTIQYINLGASAINRTSKSIKVVIASLILPVGDVANANTIIAEVYIVNKWQKR